MQEKSKKKVTFLISSLVGGGAERVCVNIANSLARQGWEVDLVILNLNNSVYHDQISDRINLVVLGVDHIRNSGIPLLRYIYKSKPERFLVFNYELAVMMVLLRVLFKFKLKIIARNINTLSKKRNQVRGFWQKYVLKYLIDTFYCKVDHVVNQCNAMRDDLVGLYPILADRTSVIYNPVAETVQNFAKSHDLSKVKKEDYLLCVGRLEKQKGFQYAIQGFASIAEEFPGLRLKIVGVGSEERNLKKIAFDMGVVERVDFEGFQKNIIPYYINAKATILTSLYEGFPNVLIESITLGTPVVAFDCPSGPKEIVIENVNGYLVDYQDMSDLNNKLMKIICNKIDAKDIIKTTTKNNLDCVTKQYHNLISSYS